MTVDPVCGMEVAEDPDGYNTTYQGETFYFCSQECKDAFEANPSMYVSDVA